MSFRLQLAATLSFALAALPLRAADSPAPYAIPAAGAVNAFGIDLLKCTGKPGENALLSPYSIQEALMMAYEGGDGRTRAEMVKTLHFTKNEKEFGISFVNLQQQISSVHEWSDNAVKNETGAAPKEPLVLLVANRLFTQAGFEFKKPYLESIKYNYSAPSDELDFEKDPGKAAQTINDWISAQTSGHIAALIPPGAITADTRLVIANAVYMKAPWRKGFRADITQPGPFHINGGAAVDVPMMQGFDMKLGYAKRKGYEAVSIPYAGSQLQFLILLPEKADGLPALEAKLTPELLSSCAKLETVVVDLALPKFKLEPPAMALAPQLQALGMKSAFGKGADFSRMTSSSPVSISGVFHKCFLSVDENGTEAAAATAIAMAAADGEAPAKTKVDRPFLFAVQDRDTGACIFLGRVTDPRGIAPPKTTE